MITARNSYLLAYDNISYLPPWLSDAFCRLATGGGFSTRGLYTDDEEIIFDAKRPVITNGIEDFATRGDLLERGLLVRLPAIPETHRLAEKAYWRRFQESRPRLLGALLDRVVGGIRMLPSVKLDCLPRMADFAQWVVACERGAGEPARFLAVYQRNQSSASEQALEDAVIVGPLLELVKEQPNWCGSSSALLEELNRRGPELCKSKNWPKNGKSLSGLLRRLAPSLRRVQNLHLQFDERNPVTRTKVIRFSTEPSPPSQSGTQATTPLGASPSNRSTASGTESKSKLRFRNNPHRGIPGLDSEVSG